MRDAPKLPYVYQPYGKHDVQDPERLWGVANVSLDTTIKGLTQEEARSIREMLVSTHGQYIQRSYIRNSRNEIIFTVIMEAYEEDDYFYWIRDPLNKRSLGMIAQKADKSEWTFVST